MDRIRFVGAERPGEYCMEDIVDSGYTSRYMNHTQKISGHLCGSTATYQKDFPIHLNQRQIHLEAPGIEFRDFTYVIYNH